MALFHCKEFILFVLIKCILTMWSINDKILNNRPHGLFKGVKI